MKLKKINSARIKETWFYLALVGFPFFVYVLLQVIPGYFYIFIFAVQKYNPNIGGYEFTSDIFYNFREFFTEMFRTTAWAIAVKNSLIQYVFGWLMTPISLFVSFYIARKMPGSRIFKFILMMPGMMSGMIWVLLYKNFTDRALVELLGLQYGPLSNINQQFAALLIYSLWIGAAGNMLLYTGVLSGSAPELLEAGRSDGLSTLGEFWHIALPQLYPVWIVSVIGGFAGFFNSSPGTFEFYGLSASHNTYTIGYLMFSKVMGSNDTSTYTFNAAGSIVFSLIVMPITLFGKWALERYGPSEDTRKPIRWFWKRGQR